MVYPALFEAEGHTYPPHPAAASQHSPPAQAACSVEAERPGYRLLTKLATTHGLASHVLYAAAELSAVCEQ